MRRGEVKLRRQLLGWVVLCLCYSNRVALKDMYLDGCGVYSSCPMWTEAVESGTVVRRRDSDSNVPWRNAIPWSGRRSIMLEINLHHAESDVSKSIQYHRGK